jgi:transcriptional regulator with XRE-family HTH domain
MTLGQKLHNAIKDSGITMPEVAKHIGISEGNLYKLIKKDTFEVAYLLKASSLLGKPLSYFIDDGSLVGSTISQSGTTNIGQTGSGNSQKIMSSATGTRHTGPKANIDDLVIRLSECQQMNQALTRELDITRELVKSKDEMIALLRSSRDRTN